jgi:hypothetical protein
MIPAARRRWFRFPILLLCLYAPYAWLVLTGFPWDSYRWHWIRLWPILPGLPVAGLVHPWGTGLGDRGEFLLMAATTAAIVAALAALARRPRPRLAPLALAVALPSLVNAWLAYAVFRA